MAHRRALALFAVSLALAGCAGGGRASPAPSTLPATQADGSVVGAASGTPSQTWTPRIAGPVDCPVVMSAPGGEAVHYDGPCTGRPDPADPLVFRIYDRNGQQIAASTP